MLDFHSHILPKMDDGSASVKESIEMLRMLAHQGVTDVVLSSHFYPERETPQSFLQRRNAKLQELLDVIKTEQGLPSLYLGAEVAYYEGITRSEHLPDLCLFGTDYIMIEMPFIKWNERIVEDIISIKNERRLKPILAHVDRYLSFGNKEQLFELSKNGILFQINADSFSYFFVRRTVNKMLSNDMIQFIGSDSHNTSSRKPNMDFAQNSIVKYLGQDILEHINSQGRFVLKSAQKVF